MMTPLYRSRVLAARSGISLPRYVLWTYSAKLVVEPRDTSPRFIGLMYSDATFLASRAAIVAGASFTRLRFRVRTPLTNSSCQQSNHQNAPSLKGFGF